MRPLAIDLCCGLGGWSEGLLAEGWDVVGFDVERHVYGGHKYPSSLILQDIRTLCGAQFKGKVSLIVASPPCQKYSYMAMPWTRAKELKKWYADPEHPDRIVQLNELFDACSRIGKEAGCPIIIENVRGAQPWVGRARWNFGSYYLWGDVPALIPPIASRVGMKPTVAHRPNATRFEPRAVTEARISQKVLGFRFDGSGRSFQSASVAEGHKVAERIIHIRDGAAHTKHLTNGAEHQLQADEPHDHRKGKSSGAEWFDGNHCVFSSKSTSRKAASALIAKIPELLARHIAQVYHP